MKTTQAILQIGKNGLTDRTLELIKHLFKNRENVKIVLLKGAGHNREKAKEIAEKIRQELGNHYTYKIIGFTIFLKKWRKEIKAR